MKTLLDTWMLIIRHVMNVITGQQYLSKCFPKQVACAVSMCVHVWVSVCIHVSVGNDGWGQSMEPSGWRLYACVWVQHVFGIFNLRGVSAVLFFGSSSWKPLGWISSFNTAGRLCLHWLQSLRLDATSSVSAAPHTSHCAASQHREDRCYSTEVRRSDYMQKILFRAFSSASVHFLWKFNSLALNLLTLWAI